MMSFRKPITAISIGVVLLFFGAAFSQPGNIYTFSSGVKITEGPFNDAHSGFFQSSGQHYVAYRGDTVYVVWSETRFTTPPVGNHIFFARSKDNGQSFGPNVRVNSTPAGFNPSMRVDSSGNIYVAYQRQGDIFFTKSTDGGNTFTPALNVIDPAELSFNQELPSMAVNNKEQVFICWIDYRTNPKTIFTVASYDSGNTFEPNLNVNPVLGDRENPDISADDNGLVYVVYEELLPNIRQIAFSRSIDSGASFDFQNLTSDLPADGSACCGVNPSIASREQGKIGIVWLDGRSDQWTLRFSSSSDYGQTFSPSVRVDDDVDVNIETFPETPSLFCQNGIFYVVWGDNRIDPMDSVYIRDPFFSYSVDGGSSFAVNRDVSAADNYRAARLSPSLGVNESGKIFVAWIQDSMTNQFFDPLTHGSAGIPDFIKGDLNLDSLLTAVDIVMEFNAAYLGQSFPAPYGNADVNCDSLLTSVDVVLLLNATFLGNPFPCN